MTVDKGILIKNVYYMLSYAFQILKQDNYEQISTELFENVQDMFATILGKGVSKQLKQGLYREYVMYEDNLSTLRGKLNLQKTIGNKIAQNNKLYCEFDELSENNLLNGILKTTMSLLLKNPEVGQERKKLLKKNLLYFSDIDEVPIQNIHWKNIRFRRENQDYRMLINVCNLVLEGMILSTEKGNVKWATFIDEQRMSRLYEKFILEYYRYHHPELSPNADQIPWILDDGIADFLPVMQTDITLRNSERILIIDAKYYTSTMQTQFGTNTLHSNNLYQIFTYVKNMDIKDDREVSGMLLYAKTEEKIQPDHNYKMSGNQISVKTLDLNQEFERISAQLDEIVDINFRK